MSTEQVMQGAEFHRGPHDGLVLKIERYGRPRQATGRPALTCPWARRSVRALEALDTPEERVAA
jgi:hypothetical protein